MAVVLCRFLAYTEIIITFREAGMDMELNSTVVTLRNLLSLHFESGFQDYLQAPKIYFSIPDYQREYKWEKPKIKTFVSNVMQRSKFLGIITTEVSNEPYLSIVDGQQRLTTIMLMLAWLYNACAEEGETETQQEILRLTTFQAEGNQRFKLDNASVGEYLHLMTDERGCSRIKLEINSEEDIFKQADQFDEAWNTIDEAASDIRENNPVVTLDEYKQRLLDCEILLFSQKNTNGLQQGSIEEIYIDINEKSQQLKPEDIFKGHCFAICKTDVQQEQVKRLWRSAKKNFFSMEHVFKQITMDMFLHYYLLTQEATQESRKDIKTDLTIDGENIITKRYNTPTKVIGLITEINKYQANLLEFKAGLGVARPEFTNIMTAAAQELGNNRDRLFEMQSVLNDVFSCKQNLFKLPLYYFIDQNMRKPPTDKLSYAQLSGFVYLYNIYMFLFARVGSSRKRSDLANGLIYKIKSGQGYLRQFIKEIGSYANGLNLELDEKLFKEENSRKHLYQILDHFQVEVSRTPVISDSDLSFKMRLFPDTYNVEHLVVHRSHTITWTSAHYDAGNPQPNMKYEFSTDDFRTCTAWIGPNNHWANFIWIDAAFNRDYLKNKDIISKLLLLRGNCLKEQAPENDTYAKKHVHIELICQHIMSTTGFDALYQDYQSDAPRDTVREHYRQFIDNYFSEESAITLCHMLSEKFSNMIGAMNRLAQ